MNKDISKPLQPISVEKEMNKKTKEPKEQIRFEFVGDDCLTLSSLQISEDHGLGNSDIDEIANFFSEPLNSSEKHVDTSKLLDFLNELSLVEKDIIKENILRKKTLVDNKKAREKHHYINLINLTEKQIVESENSKNYFDKIILDFNTKEHKHLFIDKDIISNVNTLKDKFPNFSKVIDYILTHAFFCYKKSIPFFLPPINLNGSPSIGKTFFVKSLSKILQTDYYDLSVSTLISSHELTGLSRYWGNAGTGLLFNNVIKKANYAESILLLDEICKANYMSNNNGSNISNVLIQLMDKEQAKTLTETCLDIEIDMSHLLIISTSNCIEKLPDVLRSRIVNFNIEKPDKDQLHVIIQSITNNILEELQIRPNELTIKIDKKTSDLFYGQDLRDAREVLKNHIMMEYMSKAEEEVEKPYNIYH